MSEHESLILALDRPSSTEADHRQSPKSVSEPATEYAFTIKLERIESSPPTFVQEKEDVSRGKVLHGTLVPQNVFEEAKLQGRGAISVTCPKNWTLRLWLWKKLGDGEPDSEVHCIATMPESTSRHHSIQVMATKISGCYPVLGYLGIMILLSPIIAVLWPAMFFGKFFFPLLILLLIARGMLLVWPDMIPVGQTFDLFLLTFFLLGGTLKVYWWAINFGSDDDSSDESEAKSL